tara:strand:- start:111 stop:749 length:639 start_codon:yes stop_codon:yes gene_type:complete
MGANTAMAIGGTIVGAGASIFTAVKANKEAEEYENKKNTQEGIITDLENSRQDIYNPMANLTNEAKKIGVATQAAKFQAEQADIALANTLDTMRASGMSAGGATALAQMALKSKQGISADIQKQELQNAKNIAGQQMKINEQKAQGAKWAWEEQEGRDMIQLDRAQNLYDKYEAQEFYNEAQMWNAVGNTASSLTSGLGNIMQGIELDQQMP